jgi:hypothetical protein
MLMRALSENGTVVLKITSFVRDGRLMFKVKNVHTLWEKEKSLREMIQLARVVYGLDGGIVRCG